MPRAAVLPLVLLALAACGRDPAAPPAPGTATSSATPVAAPLVDPPDVVWVTLDTVRADHLHCYGYFRETSPHLDKLAEESLVFERCLAPMSTTLPSHTSMLTAVWPEEHGVIANLRMQTVYERDPALASLAELFADAGYDTAAFLGAYPLRREAGLAAGFAVYDDPGDRQRAASETTDLALAWLERAREAPLFLWVHYYDPHSPYEAPAPFSEAFRKEQGLTQWLDERGIGRVRVRESKRKGRPVVTEASANGYDAELLYTDAQLGRLLDALRARERWDRTAVLVLGDHGEGLNQHEEPGHGLVWDEQLRVPFVLRWPGLAPRRVPDLVSVVDMAPTLLGLLPLPGRERLLDRATGVDVLAPGFAPRPLLATTSERKVNLGTEFLALTTGRWKYLNTGEEDGEHLFDLDADPHELQDLSDAHPDVLAELRDEARRLLSAQRARSGGTVREATQEELSALRELGYGGEEDPDDE